MSQHQLQGVFLGLTITSTWGNGHATTYRGLLKEFASLGHKVTFLERDLSWYRENREFQEAPYCEVQLYGSLVQLQEQYGEMVRNADFVVVGSYVPEGIEIGEWVMAQARGLKIFYDIDTPITLSHLLEGDCKYLSSDLVSQYDLYLSFTGGPTLTFLEQQLRSPAARALYCSVDPALYYQEPCPLKWDLGYLGTYAEDRQAALRELLLRVAETEHERRFAVAGPQYPKDITWPGNVERIEHLAAARHREFYNSQAFTLNLTRRDMVRSGYSPSVRLFEAAACGVPIMTDEWPGLDALFKIGSEILIVRSGGDVMAGLRLPIEQRLRFAENARKRTLRDHTAQVRASELQSYIFAAQDRVSHLKGRSKIPAEHSETRVLI